MKKRRPELLKKEKKLFKRSRKRAQTFGKKYNSLKSGKTEMEDLLHKSYKPIVDPLKQIVENTLKDDIEHDASQSEIDKDGTEKKIMKRIKRKTMSDTPSTSNFTPESKIKRLKKNEKRMFSSSILRDDEGKKQASMNVSSEEDVSIIAPEAQSTQQPDRDSDIEYYESRRWDNNENESSSAIENMSVTDSRVLKNLGPISREYVKLLLTDRNNVVDNTYGVYFRNNNMMLGQSTFSIDKNENIYVDNKKIEGSPGILKLIFRRMPDDEMYGKADLDKYKSILQITNAHRKDFSSFGQMRGNKGHKYRHIIAPLFTQKSGTGITTDLLPEYKRVLKGSSHSSNIDYVHWNDANELVDRLRLLIASRDAGNTGVDNEILSILEELREEGIIV
ncbi:hypothetical protein KPH14_012727 [Odynerus spinipes]|uniref:DUF8207 domain-containing protein n=1 Tax=Odynerus spinipes TaxID=1348599 RepID=A0AAD9RHQ0_9HYME|nr:hypothetical protein KPH14_012727 [Odynerus spinipes]